MQVYQRPLAGRDLCAVLLSKPSVDGLFAGQVVERLAAKPLAPVTVAFAAIAGDASTAQIFWHC